MSWVAVGGGFWLIWQLLRQNGRMLLRFEDLEKRLDDLESGEGDDRRSRFNNRSVGRSKIKRDGLKAGTAAPAFQLPRLDGRGDLSVEDLRGKRVLLVFSDPHCGPCNYLAPKLELLHREHLETNLVMISRGEPKGNRAKMKEHGLTFPIVLQRQWEISRLYAMFATPMAYLIDENGVILHDVAVGVDQISILLTQANSDGPTMHAAEATVSSTLPVPSCT